jgi:hypothetical protein
VTSAGYLDSTVTSAGRSDCTPAAPAETDFNDTIMKADDYSCASSAAAIAAPAGREGELPFTL